MIDFKPQLSIEWGMNESVSNHRGKMRPSLDHGILSPNGKVSQRCKNEVIKRWRKEQDEWFLANKTPVNNNEIRLKEKISQIERLLLDFRHLAKFQPKKYEKHIAKAEKELGQLKEMLNLIDLEHN